MLSKKMTRMEKSRFQFIVWEPKNHPIPRNNVVFDFCPEIFNILIFFKLAAIFR